MGSTSTRSAPTRARGSELLLFFNYDGVNRIAGSTDRNSGTLNRLLGSEKSAKYLVGRLQKLPEGVTREREILRVYIGLLKQRQEWSHVVPFRVESAGSSRTSHYLIFATRNGVGFRVMKETMWKLGDDGHEEGGLSFNQSSRTDQTAFFHPEVEDQRARIIAAIPEDGVPLTYFTRVLPETEDDRLIPKVYRKRLWELEDDGLIVFHQPDDATRPFKRRPNGSFSRIQGVTVHRTAAAAGRA